MTKEQLLKNAAIEELKKRAARSALAPFILYTSPSYQCGWAHQEICQKLEEFLKAVIEKKSPRLIICMPPRSGKSEIVSRRFPAFSLGCYKNLKFMGTSYSSDLAVRMSKDVQRIIRSQEYATVFPETQIPKRGDSSGFVCQAEQFEVIGSEGAYIAAGVGGALTGSGCDILLIDDPLKDRKSADSKTIRDGVWDWYTSTAYTRISPGGGVIVMCTRWHTDDLIGRLLKHESADSGDKWEVINYPAIAETDEKHRKKGEALHPERYSLERLQQIKKAVGTRDWESLYQQHPVVDGGQIFKRDWLRYWTTLPSKFDEVVLSWDMTFKDTDSSDFVVGQVWGRHQADFYLIDQVRERMDFVATVTAFKDLAEKYPQAIKKFVEDKANGSAVISSLKRKIMGIVPVTPTESKTARAYAVTPVFESHNVYFPHPDIHPWVSDVLVPEFTSFPSVAHDDQVDAATQALSKMIKGTSTRIHPNNVATLRRGGLRR